MINRNALFSDETTGYRLPQDIEAGDFVTLKIRTGRDNVKTVVLHTVRACDVGREAMRADGLAAEQPAGANCFPMRKAACDERFDWFETEIRCGEEMIRYWFELSDETETVFYNRMGPVNGSSLRAEHAFEILPGFSVPDWARGAVMYQIMTDRFANGDPSNDVLSNEYYYIDRPVEKARWERPVSVPDVGIFYGGDLVGVREKLDYLKYLGVEVIYFNPLFVSPSSHGYDVQDYDHIDPHFTGFVEDLGELLPKGVKDNRKADRYIRRVTDRKNLEYADAYFADFVKAAHERGIRVILDGVFNHCGSFHKWLDRERIYEACGQYEKGAFLSEESPYRDRFFFEKGGKWPCNACYKGWWDNVTLPKLNYGNAEKLREYILEIGKKWVSPPYSADGWRIDVAADVCDTEAENHAFWQDFRKAVKSVRPDAIILAEHYGNPEPWLRGNEWDTVMNYDAFMEPVSYFLTGMEKHSKDYCGYLRGNGNAFFAVMREKLSRLPLESRETAMNQLSNHDHSRFMTRTNSRIGTLETAGPAAAAEGVSHATFREGVVMQFTLPGAPTVYYGDETGLPGWTDPDNRRPFPWGHEDWTLVAFHRDVIRIHKTYTCLSKGSYLPLLSGLGYAIYGRFDETESALVIINHSDRDRNYDVPVWRIHMPENGVVKRILQTGDSGYNIGQVEERTVNGELRVRVPAWAATVYVAKR